MSRFVSSRPFSFPLSSALKNLLFKLSINRKKPVINNFRTNLTIISGVKKEERKEDKGMYPEIRKTCRKRPEFNLHQETHYNGGEQNSARKSFIVAATPDEGADPP